MLRPIRTLALCCAATVAMAQAAQARLEPYMAEIIYMSADYCPDGYVQTLGQTLPIISNQGLFALMGTSFGGNGTTTFKLPLMRMASVHPTTRAVVEMKVCIALQGIFPTRD